MYTNSASSTSSIGHEIIKVCQLLHGKGWLAAADGNLSHKLEGSEILITPSGKAKAFLHSEDLARMEEGSGKPIFGEPSSEKWMHLSVYQKCPEARAVVHAHPPTAIALSVAFPEWRELPGTSLSELILAVGSVPIVPYARPGSQGMGESLIPFLPEHRVMVLARHGALAWGETLMEAYMGMERLEHTAVIIHKALQVGGLNPLPDEEIEHLQKLRQKLGNKTL
jgi:L-fuculose-phosphate aldolase